MDELDKLLKRLKNLDARARVGALDPENAQKLAYAEFGTKTSPARPVLSATTNKYKESLGALLKKKLQGVIDGKNHTGEEILQDVGEDLVELVQEEMDAGFGAPLDPETAQSRRRRGVPAPQPLVDSGDLRASIKVETKDNLGDWED